MCLYVLIRIDIRIYMDRTWVFPRTITVILVHQYDPSLLLTRTPTNELPLPSIYIYLHVHTQTYILKYSKCVFNYVRTHVCIHTLYKHIYTCPLFVGVPNTDRYVYP